MKVPAAATVFLLCLLSPPATAGGHRVRDETCGLSVELPSSAWRVRDLSAHGVLCRLYAPGAGMLPRVTLMRYPAAFLPDGMATRAARVEHAAGNRRVRIGPGTLAGAEAEEYVWENANSRAIEVGTLRDGAYLIVQVAAALSEWEDESKAAAYRRVLESVRFLAAPEPELRVDPKTPAEVRALRAKRRGHRQTWSIASHDVRVDLHPDERRLEVTDDFTVEARDGSVGTLSLICTHVEVRRITSDGVELEHRRVDDRTVRVTLDRPIEKGDTRTLRFEAHSSEFRFAVDQELIAEVAVLGQVDPVSSFSSHVSFYPVDERNDAAVRMAISVPEGYVAVTGGEPQGVEAEGDRRVFRYAEPLRTPRLLPYGFAAARYASVSGRTAGGLELAVYHREGFEKRARQRIEVLVECGNLFEEWMGPLPWKRVAFCQVKPHRKETGVSLPGLVLFSDVFFQDLEGFELTGAAATQSGGGPLLFVDELAHQWNAYAVPLPNELAEGVSTFLDHLYIEAKAGRDEARKGLRLCAEGYLAQAEMETDVAIADPALYRSPIYRAASFGKTAVVLDLLRDELSDERFFTAWKTAFEALRGGPADYADLERELGKAAGVDLRTFFDRWFFQAGHPRLTFRWRPADPGKLALEVEQTQPGGIFEIEVPVEIATAGGVHTRLLRLDRRQQSLELGIEGEVRSVRVDPEGRFLLLRARVAGP
jgi:aminopeptidase N